MLMAPPRIAPHDAELERAAPVALRELAQRINAAHQACESALTAGVEHAVIAGRTLREAKAQLDHGAWLPWLAEHTALSPRLAQKYMQLAQAWPRLADAPRVAQLSMREALEHVAAAARSTARYPASQQRTAIELVESGQEHQFVCAIFQADQQERAAERVRAAAATALVSESRVGPAAFEAVQAAEARLAEAERVLEEWEREQSRERARLWRLIEDARDELEAVRRPLLTCTDVAESEEPCPPLTRAEMLAAFHQVNGCGAYDFWLAAGYPDPGEFEASAYRQCLRPGDDMCLPGPAWRLGVASPGVEYHRWVVSVSGPGQPRWARFFWLRGVSAGPGYARNGIGGGR